MTLRAWSASCGGCQEPAGGILACDVGSNNNGPSGPGVPAMLSMPHLERLQGSGLDLNPEESIWGT